MPSAAVGADLPQTLPSSAVFSDVSLGRFAFSPASSTVIEVKRSASKVNSCNTIRANSYLDIELLEPMCRIPD